MSKHRIKINALKQSSIQSAIEELRQYRNDLVDKLDRLRLEIAKYIESQAAAGFSKAFDDVFAMRPDNGSHNDEIRQETRPSKGHFSGGRRAVDASPLPVRVDVSISELDDNVTVVLAKGPDVMFAEFGAGVMHNGAVGGSPNPYGAQLGMTIGSYGKNGEKNVWGFYRDGNLYLTHGTEAKMPMAKAVGEVMSHINTIVRRVFRR